MPLSVAMASGTVSVAMTYDQQVRRWTAAAERSAKKVLSSKKNTVAFLKRVGIIDKSGKGLAKAYR